MKKKIQILPILLSLLLLGGCLTNSEFNSDFDKATLIGKIYDKANLPCSNVEVQVDGDVVASTDIDGRFYISNLSRGTHTFTFTKKGYRTDTIEFEFLNALQSLYHKMISMEQILTEIEKALDEKDYARAYTYLNEGSKVEPDNLILKYLAGIFLYEQGRYELAVEKLESMVEEGFTAPYIYLTLADIYEYKLEDYARANANLLKYLEQADDRENTLRQQELEGQLTRETTPTETEETNGESVSG